MPTEVSLHQLPNFGQNRKRLQRLCDRWNAACPIGTEVDLRHDSGRVVRTRTRSAAEVLEGHSAVIWLEGVRGCYLLECVSAILPPEAA